MSESYGIGRGKRENDPVQNDNWEEDFIKITIPELWVYKITKKR